MTAATDVTALDVARELVATKLALVTALENVVNVCPAVDNDAEPALNEWVYTSPLGRVKFDDAIGYRADAIGREIVAAVGSYLLRRA